MHRLRADPRLVVATPRRLLSLSERVHRDDRGRLWGFDLLWIEEANEVLRRTGKKQVGGRQVVRIVSELEQDASLAGYAGIHLGFHRIRALVLTHSRATRDVTFFCSRVLPTAVLLEETPLLLTKEVLRRVQQVVKWVEPLSKRKQAVRVVGGVSALEGRAVTVRVATQGKLLEYQQKLFRVRARQKFPGANLTVTTGRPAPGCNFLVSVDAPRLFEEYQRLLLGIQQPGLVVTFVNAEDSQLFPQLKEFLKYCDSVVEREESPLFVRNVCPASW